MTQASTSTLPPGSTATPLAKRLDEMALKRGWRSVSAAEALQAAHRLSATAACGKPLRATLFASSHAHSPLLRGDRTRQQSALIHKRPRSTWPSAPGQCSTGTGGQSSAGGDTQAFSKVCRAQSVQAPQAVATRSSPCSASKLPQPSRASRSMSRSETRWQMQTIMRRSVLNGLWKSYCNANRFYLQAVQWFVQLSALIFRPVLFPPALGCPAKQSQHRLDRS